MTIQERKWLIDNIDWILAVLIFILSMLAISQTITLERTNNQISDLTERRLNGSDFTSAFSAKNDDIRVLIKVNREDVALARQAYIYSRQSVGDNRSLVEIEREAQEKISGIIDYTNTVNAIETLNTARTIMVGMEKELTDKQKLKDHLLQTLTNINYLIVFLAFAATSRALGAKLENDKTIKKDFNKPSK